MLRFFLFYFDLLGQMIERAKNHCKFFFKKVPCLTLGRIKALRGLGYSSGAGPTFTYFFFIKTSFIRQSELKWQKEKEKNCQIFEERFCNAEFGGNLMQ